MLINTEKGKQINRSAVKPNYKRRAKNCWHCLPQRPLWEDEQNTFKSNKQRPLVLRQVERSTPSHLDLHLILDNSSTHKTQEVKTWLSKHPRITVHFTPTSASWLNAVESWFSQLERRALYRGIFTNVKELRDAIHYYINVHNKKLAKPFVWVKNAESIIASVQRAKESLENNAKN